jgi:hypothetical protein
MQAVEFQARVKNGVIQVPEKFRSEIRGQVRVIVLAEEKPEPYDIITELMNNPLQVPDFKPLTREEIYER